VKKVVVISGGATGIGFSTAKSLLMNGYFVAIIDSDLGALNLAKEELGKISEDFTAINFDLTDWDAGDTLFERGDLTHVDILINNVNFRSSANFLSESEETWGKTFDVTVRSAFTLSQSIIKKPNRCGERLYIINVGSILANLHGAQSPSYHASKSALEGLTKYLAIEIPPLGTKVNANYLEIGFLVQNRNWQKFLSDENVNYRDLAIKHLPNGEVGRDADVSNLIEFLISGRADFVNGASIKLDGGATLQEQFELLRNLS